MDIIELNKKAWDKIGKEIISPYIEHEKFSEMFDLFCQKIGKNGSVLDLGCGPGIPIDKELIERGFRVTGVDNSDTMIQLAKKNVPEANYIKISMTDMNFDQKFDGIIANYSMLSLDPKRFEITAKKISEILNKDGVFLLALNEPSPSGHKEEENITEVIGQKMYSRPYTESEINEIFSKFGLKIIKVEREVVVTEKYGTEHCLIVLMEEGNEENSQSEE